MSLADTLKEISGYTKLAGEINIDQSLRWIGAAHLSFFTENVKKIEKENESFANAVAEHKLKVLNEFTRNWKKTSNLTGAFKDAYMGIYNIGLIDGTNVIRSSQPSRADLAFFINEIKIRIVINLRKENSYWENYTQKDEDEVCIEGWTEYLNIPMENYDDTSLLPGHIKRILDRINYYIKPVLVHSGEGKARMGAVAAAYRLVNSGWKLEEAMEEASHFGFEKMMNPHKYALIKSFDKSTEA